MRTIDKLNAKYADRLDCPISDETADEYPIYFVELKEGWRFAFHGGAGAFDNLKEVKEALATSVKIEDTDHATQ
jgi:hypothetical protein